MQCVMSHLQCIIHYAYACVSFDYNTMHNYVYITSSVLHIVYLCACVCASIWGKHYLLIRLVYLTYVKWMYALNVSMLHAHAVTFTFCVILTIWYSVIYIYIYNAVAIGPVTGPLARWLLVRQLVTCKASANQIHAFTSCEYIYTSCMNVSF